MSKVPKPSPTEGISEPIREAIHQVGESSCAPMAQDVALEIAWPKRKFCKISGKTNLGSDQPDPDLTFSMTSKDVKNHFSVPVNAIKEARNHFKVIVTDSRNIRQVMQEAEYFPKCYPGALIDLEYPER